MGSLPGSPSDWRGGTGGRWAQLNAIGGRLSDKDGVKVERLVDDLRLVVDAGRDGTTRDVLETVRDDVGLGTAMNLLDRTGGGQGSSHLDDLEGLLGVADLHPDPAGFEAWLRTAFQHQADPAGVTLSTIHRVKGREWDRVAVFGVTEGLVPHRLAEDVEEERRVLHVAITRGRHRVALLTDHTRRSGFLDELAGTAPRRPVRPARVTAPAPVATTTSAPDGIGAEHGLVVRVAGGHEGTVEEVDGRAAMIRLPSGASLRVRFGERVEHDGKRAALAPPSRLWGAAADAEAALRAWRTSRATADAVPAYVVVNDKHLRGIAMARPTTPTELAACDGIGPTKLERYGDEMLALLEPFVRKASRSRRAPSARGAELLEGGERLGCACQRSECGDFQWGDLGEQVLDIAQQEPLRGGNGGAVGGGGDVTGPGRRCVHDLGGGQATRGEAQLSGFVAEDQAARQQQVGGRLEADDPGQQGVRSQLADEAEADERELDLGLGRDVSHVGGQRQRGADTDGMSVDGGDDGFGEVPRERRRLGSLGGVEGGGFGEVEPGAEGTAGAGEHDRPDVVVVLGAVERGRQVDGHQRRPAVELLGTIEGDRRHAIGRLVPDGPTAIFAGRRCRQMPRHHGQRGRSADRANSSSASMRSLSAGPMPPSSKPHRAITRSVTPSRAT